jgi:hypothetical protein
VGRDLPNPARRATRAARGPRSARRVALMDRLAVDGCALSDSGAETRYATDSVDGARWDGVLERVARRLPGGPGCHLRTRRDTSVPVYLGELGRAVV